MKRDYLTLRLPGYESFRTGFLTAPSMEASQMSDPSGDGCGRFS
jgi:hypothetical protein